MCASYIGQPMPNHFLHIPTTPHNRIWTHLGATQHMSKTNMAMTHTIMLAAPNSIPNMCHHLKPTLHQIHNTTYTCKQILHSLHYQHLFVDTHPRNYTPHHRHLIPLPLSYKNAPTHISHHKHIQGAHPKHTEVVHPYPSDVVLHPTHSTSKLLHTFSNHEAPPKQPQPQSLSLPPTSSSS
jgi:hypothetical protein